MNERGVLHVSDSDGWTGGTAQMLHLASGLQDRGWKVAFAARRKASWLPKAAELGLAVHPVALRQDYDLLSAARLSALMDQEGLSILHAHHSRSHSICLLAQALRRLLGKPGVLVVSRRVTFPPKGNPLSRWKYTSRLIDHFVAVADAIRDGLVAYGVEPGRVSVIRSGVDLARFSPRPADPRVLQGLGVPPGVPLVGKIANFSAWKGQETFLQAAKLLVEQGRKAHFLLAGRDTDGPEAKELVNRLRLEGCVCLAGFRTDIPDLLPCLGVSVNAASQGEGVSGALRESLAMGVPVVATDVGGNKELFPGEDRRFLVSPGDPAALAERIAWTLDHQDEARALVRDWRNWAAAECSIESHLERTEALYLRLLGR